jgi:N-acetylglucosaminyl-diphospho-decaprenol L-rhamnosyltransferase
MTLDVVIVNWNSGEHLRRCVASLAAIAAQVPGLRVIVVDNGSADGSLDRLEEAGLRLTIVRNATNRGFAAACNQGSSVGDGDALLFLNPDTIVPGADSLVAPLAVLGVDQRVGVVGVQLRDAQGRVTRSCTRFPTPGRFVAWSLGLDRIAPALARPQFVTEFDHLDTADVDIVMGAFFMTTRSVFRTLGGFDERFFVYYEEVDFAWRARAAGLLCRFIADVHVTHAGRGTTERLGARRYFYVTSSRVLYAQRHFARLGAAAATTAALVAEPLVRGVYSLSRGEPAEALQMVRGTAMAWRELPAMLSRQPTPQR